MKKNRTPKQPRVLRAACTVSAAALMLGVSHATTVGLNFQCDWSDAGAASYTGDVVTATAFGIAPEFWQNLTPLPTGYNHGGSDPGPFTLNEVIGTTNSTPGLHRLDAGSLNITWTAVAGNDAGYGWGGNHPAIGNQQVMYSFLRDDVFIYTSPTTTNGYSVNIAGLKSVFPSSSYVIQVVATTDSANAFTNAIVTAGASSQNLNYSASQSNFGVFGDISSVSTPLSADQITIAGAPALDLRGSGGPALASTIAGIIITDEPIIQTGQLIPSPATITPTNATLQVTAVGVPPLQYQWRKNGTDIAGATNNIYNIATITPANAGVYDAVVSNQYGSATSDPVPVTSDILLSSQAALFTDSKPAGTEHDAVNSGATWLASSKDGANVTRTGVASFSSDSPGRLTFPGSSDLAGTSATTTNGSIAFWMMSSGTTSDFGNAGSMLLEWHGGGIQIVEQDAGTIKVSASGTGNNFSSAGVINDGNWHHIALTYDQSDVGFINLYIDGTLDTTNSNGAQWSWPSGENIYVGLSQDAYWKPYDGTLDDIRFYSRILTDSEVTTLDSTDGLIDPSTLALRLNFDAAPTTGIAVNWPAGSLLSSTTAKGSYTNVAAATSPYPIVPAAGTKFYELSK